MKHDIFKKAFPKLNANHYMFAGHDIKKVSFEAFGKRNILDNTEIWIFKHLTNTDYIYIDPLGKAYNLVESHSEREYVEVNK